MAASTNYNVSEPAELRRITNLIVTEWNQFVNREKRVNVS
jgi:hypothetical protein